MSKRVAIILNTSKAYDRKIVAGIARYLKEHTSWQLYLEDDILSKIPNFNTWNGDGIIADLDDLDVYKVVNDINIPVVGFGGGFGSHDKEKSIPYVYTDNIKIAQLGAQHLLERGFRNFAFCSLPKNRINGWAEERHHEFKTTIVKHGFNCYSFTGRTTAAKHWESVQQNLIKWLISLPKPIGLMAVTDARARHLLEACLSAGIKVPTEIAVIGVDNDEMMCDLAQPPLSSVIQGTDQLGYVAANLLDKLMHGESIHGHHVIEPSGVITRMSTDVLAIEDKLIAEALHYIKNEACNGIQVESVSTILAVSRSTLEKRFKKVLGRSVHAEISKAQLNKAKSLLLDTDLSLAQVALACAYSSEQYLSAKIKSATNKTPLQFRKNNDCS
ncbi:MAG: DNA-binding transcriptional regulator [Lentisphaeraceae bacterium]|nr:DNA-binding transcriptional regulator [Lentisphaeraceae bacterium]